MFVPYEREGVFVGLTEFSIYSFYVGAPNVRGDVYVPYVGPKVGMRVAFKKIGLKIAVALPPAFPDEVERRGSSTETSVIINQYWRSFGFDFYHQVYKGLYADNPMSELSPDRPRKFPQMPDAYVVNSGINLYYAFDPDHYSMKAAFSQTEMQTASGGSWLLNPFYNHLRLDVGDVYYPGTDPHAPTQPPNIHAGNFDTLGLGGGYGFCLVLGRWFIATQGLAGLGVQLERTDRVVEGASDNFSPAWMVNVNASAGYSHENFIWGVKGLGQMLVSRIRDLQVASQLGSAQVYAGGRF